MSETFTIEAEYTDTFGGEANYCWVRRATFDMPVGATDRQIMQRIRSELNIEGLRGRWETLGDEWRLRPYRCATIAMARVVY